MIGVLQAPYSRSASLLQVLTPGRRLWHFIPPGFGSWLLLIGVLIQAPYFRSASLVCIPRLWPLAPTHWYRCPPASFHSIGFSLLQAPCSWSAPPLRTPRRWQLAPTYQCPPRSLLSVGFSLPQVPCVQPTSPVHTSTPRLWQLALAPLKQINGYQLSIGTFHFRSFAPLPVLPRTSS